jgi:hypothetical protein
MTVIHRTLGSEEFANVLFAIVTQYIKSDYKQDPINKTLKNSAFQIIRKWADINDPLLYSKAAMKLLKEHKQIPFYGLPLYSRKDRFACGKNDKGLSNLVFDFTTPISEFFNQLLECKSVDEVGYKMLDYSGICWITREEDNILTKKFKSKRPNGWRQCYKECGIELAESVFGSAFIT